MIFFLICPIFVESAALGPGFAWLVRIGLLLRFFLSVAFAPDRRNKGIGWLYAGAWVPAISVVVLGVGLIRAHA